MLQWILEASVGWIQTQHFKHREADAQSTLVVYRFSQNQMNISKKMAILYTPDSHRSICQPFQMPLKA